MTRLNFLNVSIDNLTTIELLKQLEQGGAVYTPNVSHLLRLQWDKEFYEIYQEAEFRICDSQILWLTSHLIGTPIREKISGSDFFPAFYHHYRNDENVTVFLLGAADGVGEQAQRHINEQVGRTMVVDTYSPPYGFEKNAEECEKIIERINRSKATTLAVGLGAPKQEKWIHANRHRLVHAKIFLAIGATIDFEAGHVQRAPKWMSQIGLEWVHRVLMEPGRLGKRYFNDGLPFIWLILSELLGLYKDPFVADETCTTYSALLSINQSNKK